MRRPKQEMSIIVPLYNEADGITRFHASLQQVLKDMGDVSYEIIYCDDGSSDNTAALVRKLHEEDSRVKLLKLSRNFGKEYALTAGITAATGQAIVMLDGDGQHPVNRIPDFVQAWRDGAKVVVGVRTNNTSNTVLRRFGSWIFHRVLNKLSGQLLVRGSSDFRLLDHTVQTEFVKLSEPDRITRGLIDWLGFERTYLPYASLSRRDGAPTYSHKKLIELATNSVISFSSLPLYMFGYLGIVITVGSFFLGMSVLIEQLILEDPWHWNFTGTAMLGILLLFLVGIVLLSQGLLSLYISAIHAQSKQRPLFIIDYEGSAGIKDTHA